jgi:hypothetical protein
MAHCAWHLHTAALCTACVSCACHCCTDHAQAPSCLLNPPFKPVPDPPAPPLLPCHLACSSLPPPPPTRRARPPPSRPTQPPHVTRRSPPPTHMPTQSTCPQRLLSAAQTWARTHHWARSRPLMGQLLRPSTVRGCALCIVHCRDLILILCYAQSPMQSLCLTQWQAASWAMHSWLGSGCCFKQ